MGFPDIVRRANRRAEQTLLAHIRCLPQHRLPEVTAALSGRSMARALDLGGREGVAAQAFDRLVGMRVVVDIDRSSSPHVVADGLGGLPFADRTFDLVVSLEVLEHVSDPVCLLAEARRTLKDDAVLVLSTRQYWRTHGSPHDYFRFTRQGLDHCLTRAGFDATTYMALGGPFSVMAAAWDQLLAQAGLGRAILKQVLVYPGWAVATCLDALVMRSSFFSREPDTTGWLVVARPRSGDGPASRSGRPPRE